MSDAVVPVQRPPRGLSCPKCRAAYTVVDGERVALIVTTATRSPVSGTKRRYKRCKACGTRFRTSERIDTDYKPRTSDTEESHG
jgi:hypothetical protein